MNRRIQWVLTAALCLLSSGRLKAAGLDDVYHLGPDSEPQPGVPQGQVNGPLTLESKVYPDTTRNYWVYVPAQYDKSKPASLMIYQDGHAFVNIKGEARIPIVFDNLIYRREMPVTIGVFINPGRKAGSAGIIRQELGRRDQQSRDRVQRAG